MRLHDFLDYHAREHPDVEFAVHGDRRLTYRDALREVNRLAHALIAIDIAAGDRVAILSKNSIEYVLLYYAASKVGAVTVPLNYRLVPGEIAYIVNDAEARVLFVADEYLDLIDATRHALTTVGRFVAITASARDGWQSLAALASGQPDTPPTRAISEDADVYQMYTSGTTGRPKGAILTHRAVTTNIIQVACATWDVMQAQPGERWLVVAPVYHAAAAMTVFVGVYWSASLYIMADFVPADVVRALSEERVALTTLVPAMIQACLVMAPDVAERRYPALRLISYGGSPIAEATLQRAMEVFGCEFLQGYGMTETTAVATYLLPPDHRRALREKPDLLLSAGRPIIGTDVRVVDASDRDVPRGVVGQILVRGEQVMRAYWRQPEASSAALSGGWMHTGDAGLLDDEGFLFIHDRLSDMIVSGGENIYPREVEDVLFQHPAVADAAVIGIPDDRFGEAVKAVVVLRPGAVADDVELIDFCKDKIAGYKRPRSIDFVAALPRNPSGKVLKWELREKYWAGRRRRVA